jgi:hypothetical protein
MVARTYKTTSQDRRRKYLPYMPEEIFEKIMSDRSKLTRREMLLHRYWAYKDELKMARDEFAQLMVDDYGDEDDDLDHELNQMMEYMDQLRFSIGCIRNRIKQLGTDPTFWDRVA